MMAEEEKYLNNQINVIADYFDSWLYPSTWPFNFKRNVYSEKLAGLHSKSERGGFHHNCVGCNLESGANLIYQFLNNHRNCYNIKYFITLYSIIFYLQAERCAEVYLQLGFSRVDNPKQFNWPQFPALQRIKYWANFFKHPKTAMFIHHPTFHIKGFPDNPNIGFKGKIDDSFVKKYYSGNNNNTALRKKLTNNNYKIFYPDLIELTSELCEEFMNLIKEISSNNEYLEKLKVYQKKRP